MSTDARSTPVRAVARPSRRRACRHAFGAALLFGGAGGFAVPAQAVEPVSTSRFGSVAIGGHDPSAYHALARSPRAEAVQGGKTHTVTWRGASWRFADADSAARFEADPARYAPAYNGHCANALSLGEGLARTDGTHWQIFEGDDRLYLFYADRGRKRWLQGDREAYRVEADAAWARLSR